MHKRLLSLVLVIAMALTMLPANVFAEAMGTEEATPVLPEDCVIVEEIVTETEPVTEPETEPVTEPETEPVTEPVTEPETEPVTEPVTEPETEPVTEPVTEPETEPVTEPVTEPETEPVVNPIQVVFVCTPAEAAPVVYPADQGVDYAIQPEPDGTYRLMPGVYAYLAVAAGYETVQGQFVLTEETASPFVVEITLIPVPTEPVTESETEPVIEPETEPVTEPVSEPEQIQPPAETPANSEVRILDDSTDILSGSDAALPGGDQLFAAFAERVLYGFDASGYGTAARERLSDNGKNIYDKLKPKLEYIALYGGSSVADLSGDNAPVVEWWQTITADWTQTDFFNDVMAAWDAEFRAVHEAILDDCPFDLYWYDKTAGVSASKRIMWRIEGNLAHAWIEDLSFSFNVSRDWQGSTFTVTTDVSRVSAARQNAVNLVNTHGSKSGYEQMAAYKDYIIGAVAYDDAAAANPNTPYGDPWQIINVFDNNPSTNVVCEGYSKAFQYLCDLSGLQAISVSGTTNGPHMWNIATLDGQNYLVDVTNTDTGCIGADGSLFLAGAAYDGKGYRFYNNYGNSIYYQCADYNLAPAKYTPNPVYNVTVSATKNGTVAVDKIRATAGTVITLTVTPDANYRLKSLVVLGPGNQPVSVMDNRFTMPNGNVTITAEFEFINRDGMWLEDGIYKLYLNGKFASDFTGIYNDTCLVYQGYLVDWYNGLHAVADGIYYYLDNGWVANWYSGLYDFGNGAGILMRNGKFASDFTGIYEIGDGNACFIYCGYLASWYTGLYGTTETLYYITGGRVDTGYSGIKFTEYGIFLFSGGKLDASSNGLYADNEGHVYFFYKGYLATWYTGLYGANGIIYYLQEGRLAEWFDGVYSDTYGTFLLKGGMLDTTSNGLYNDAYGNLYYFYGGYVASWYTGLYGANNTVYYMKNGILNTSFNDIYFSEYGNYLMRGGVWDNTYTGEYTNDSGIWYISNGLAQYLISATTPVYEVQNPAGYLFRDLGNGWFESTNKGVGSSFALAKVVLRNCAGTVDVNIQGGGEADHDFGIVSNLDCTLSPNITEDTGSNVRRNFKGESSYSQTLSYEIPDNGEHFIYIKYRKDSSANAGEDCLRFSISMN